MYALKRDLDCRADRQRRQRDRQPCVGIGLGLRFYGLPFYRDLHAGGIRNIGKAQRPGTGLGHIRLLFTARNAKRQRFFCFRKRDLGLAAIPLLECARLAVILIQREGIIPTVQAQLHMFGIADAVARIP